MSDGRVNSATQGSVPPLAGSHAPESPEDQVICEACGYSFAGRNAMSRCPECGTSLLEMLRKRQKSDAVRFTSQRCIGSWPLYDIIVRPGANDPRPTARGIFASGPKAVGVVAVGGVARGVIAMGGISVGVVAMGGMSAGLFTAMGGMALGSFAFGGTAAGGISFGGMTAGFMPFGGMRLSFARALGITIDPATVRMARDALLPLVGVSTVVPVLASIGMSLLANTLIRRAKRGADA